jgi:hypothetical protein
VNYLRERSAQLEHELPGDCLDEASKIAELLIAEGKHPWIGRIRDQRGDFAGPLYAWRFEGRNAPAWTTHYVCCADDLAYDPLAGEAVPVHELAERVFGRSLPVERVFDVPLEGDVRTSIRRGVCVSSSTPRAASHPSASS